MPALLLLLACSPAELQFERDGPGRGGPGGSGGSDTPGEAELEQVPSAGDTTSWIFGLDQVHTVHITLPMASYAELNSWPDSFTWDLPYDYVEGDIRFDGELVERVGVRLKGRWGSYRGLDDKPGLKIDMDHLVDGQTLSGLKKLTLNNLGWDYSYLHEHIAYLIYRSLGLESPRTGFARVVVNDELFGLYLLVETVDSDFVDARWPEGGSLFEADYVVYPDYNYTLVDFAPGAYDQFTLKTGDQPELPAQVFAALASVGDDGLYAATEGLVDWEHFLRFWAVEHWMGQTDGYVNNRNNYLAFFPTGGDGVQLIPWDHDYTFYSYPSAWYGYGALAQACLEDSQCRQDLVVAVDAVCAEIEALSLYPEIAAGVELLNSHIADDPHRLTSMADVDYWQEYLYSWILVRSHDVRVAWGITP